MLGNHGDDDDDADDGDDDGDDDEDDNDIFLEEPTHPIPWGQACLQNSIRPENDLHNQVYLVVL